MDDISFHRVDRGKTALISDMEKSNDFVNLPPAECVSLVWELTQELWSLTGNPIAEQRLQRDFAILRRQ